MRFPTFTGILSTCLMAMSLLSYGQLGKAMGDIKKNKVSQQTISILEANKVKPKSSVSCYYQLARIYHYNQTLQDLDKAKLCYEYLLINYNRADFSGQYQKLLKKDAVNRGSFESGLKNVNDLIDTRTFNGYVRTNTMEGYKEFITKYPRSNHITDAKEKAFEVACKINTFDGYKDYLAKFPDYKVSSAKDKAFILATTANTIEVYNQYLLDFKEYRKDETHDKIFRIIKERNTIKDYNYFIENYPSSLLRNKAIEERDYIIVVDFSKTLTGLNYIDQLRKIDRFLFDNSTNVKKSLLENKAVNLLPAINTAAEFQSTYQKLNISSYLTDYFRSMLTEYFSEQVINAYGLSATYKNIINSAGSNYDSFKATLQKRVQSYTTILANYQLSADIKNDIRSRKLNEEFVLQYYPLKQKVQNRDKYSDAEHMKNAASIRSLLANGAYNSCDDRASFKSYVESVIISSTCNTCKGSGKVGDTPCRNCKGRGEVHCTNCIKKSYTTGGGWGSSSQTHEYSICCTGGRLQHDDPYYNEICWKCNGSGKMDCPTCNGWGKINTCPNCNGAGHFTRSYLDFYK